MLIYAYEILFYLRFSQESRFCFKIPDAGFVLLSFIFGFSSKVITIVAGEDSSQELLGAGSPVFFA